MIRICAVEGRTGEPQNVELSPGAPGSNVEGWRHACGVRSI